MVEEGRIVSTACVYADANGDPMADLLAQIPDVEYAFVIALVTPEFSLETVQSELRARLRAEHIVGARTAGEICAEGYSEGRIVVLAFPSSHFTAAAHLFDFAEIDHGEEISRHVLSLRQEVQTRQAGFDNEFAFLLVDGLSRREDTLVAHISTALGSTQLFGGSSGDGLRFEHAPIFHNDKISENAAALLLVRSNCTMRIFREDHFQPSEKRLVVTGAIPEKRLVTEINAEDAAPEYARCVGIDPYQLSPFIFAAHPIVVAVGDQHHVRAIQKVEDNKHLRFFSSIDEGMVLTVANSENIGDHLERLLEDLSKSAEPDLIFTCDCILRRLEAKQKQEIHRMSALLKKHHVVGFSTYGEQHNMLHVNQTLTGIAIYPPNTKL